MEKEIEELTFFRITYIKIWICSDTDTIIKIVVFIVLESAWFKFNFYIIITILKID